MRFDAFASAPQQGVGRQALLAHVECAFSHCLRSRRDDGCFEGRRVLKEWGSLPESNILRIEQSDHFAHCHFQATNCCNHSHSFVVLPHSLAKQCSDVLFIVLLCSRLLVSFCFWRTYTQGQEVLLEVCLLVCVLCQKVVWSSTYRTRNRRLNKSGCSQEMLTLVIPSAESVAQTYRNKKNHKAKGRCVSQYFCPERFRT